MKVLVIDDTKRHLDAALQTLVGHDVTVCSSHEEADRLLELQYDKKKESTLFDQYKAEGIDFYVSIARAKLESRLPYWDAVLCDLLMPAGKMSQNSKGMEFVGQEMSIGWSLAILAAMNGAKFVAVLTDTNHHDHPASALLDKLSGRRFNIAGAKALMSNWGGYVVRIEGIEQRSKDWGSLLKHLTETEDSTDI